MTLNLKIESKYNIGDLVYPKNDELDVMLIVSIIIDDLIIGYNGDLSDPCISYACFSSKKQQISYFTEGELKDSDNFYDSKKDLINTIVKNGIPK